MSSSEFIWGASAIGKFLGLSTRQVYWMLENGQLPAKKIGDRWMTTKTALTEAMALN